MRESMIMRPPVGLLAALMVAAALAGVNPAGVLAADVPDAESAAPALGADAGLDDYVVYALAANPTLAAWADLRAAASEVPRSARALPDPMLGAGYFIESVETRLGPQLETATLSQRLPFFGKRSLAGKIAESDAGVVARTYDEKRLDLIRDVKKAYYDYYRVYRVTEITRNEKTVLRSMQEVAQVKYASGIVTQQDVLKAQLALSNLEDRLTTLRADLVSATARLNELLNRAPDAPLATPRAVRLAPVPQALDSLYEVSLSKRPELSGAELLIEKEQRANALAKKQYYPDLDLALTYFWIGERTDVMVPDNGRNALRLTAMINLPIWFGKLGARVRETEARMAMARNHRDGLRTRIRSEVRDAVARARAAHEQVRLFDNVIIPQAEQTFLASEAGYRTGKVDFLNYLDSERMLLAIRQTHARLIAELGKEYAELERVTGANLTATGQ